MASTSSQSSERSSVRKKRKNIFISYSPDAGFMERKFISDTVKELKINNLAEDIWFDCDEHNTDNPCWFSFRMEAAEKCKAAILFISESYLNCPVSLYEAKIFLHRQLESPSSVQVLQIITDVGANKEMPKFLRKIKTTDCIDFATDSLSRLSLAEKTSTVIGCFMSQLEPQATTNALPPMHTPVESDFNGQFKNKKISQWTVHDLQEWLFKLGIKEFYRQSIAEQMVDGFLLMAMTDYDMVQHMGIDSRVVRRKIMHSIIEILDAEQKMKGSWHLRTRTIKAKPGSLYIIYDPTDVRLAQGVKQDLLRRGFQVQHHQKLGQSKEEFLRDNSLHMASSATAIVLLTDATTNSPFVFNEVMFCDWLGKKVVVAMFKNVWENMRASTKAVLGECAAIDFESQLYEDSVSILEHHLKPQKSLPGVVLEQSYLNRMNEGVQSLYQMCSINGVSALMADMDKTDHPTVYISYQWDVQGRVDDLQRILLHNDISCWKDPTPKVSTASNTVNANSKGAILLPTMPLARGHSGLSRRSSTQLSSMESKKDTLQSLVQQNMKASVAVIACITPKYIQSEHCVKDLLLADTVFRKPIVPVMLQYCPWPPEATSAQVRKLLARFKPIDLSNEKLFRQNVPLVLDRIKKIVLPLELRR